MTITTTRAIPAAIMERNTPAAIMERNTPAATMKEAIPAGIPAADAAPQTLSQAAT